MSMNIRVPDLPTLIGRAQRIQEQGDKVVHAADRMNRLLLRSFWREGRAEEETLGVLRVGRLLRADLRLAKTDEGKARWMFLLRTARRERQYNGKWKPERYADVVRGLRIEIESLLRDAWQEALDPRWYNGVNITRVRVDSRLRSVNIRFRAAQLAARAGVFGDPDKTSK